MAKIIKMIDPNTQEQVYPTTSSTLVLNKNGSNIHGIFDKKTDSMMNSVREGVGEVGQSIESIKNLSGMSSISDSIKRLANNVVQIQSNSVKLNIASNLVEQITPRIEGIVSDDIRDQVYKSEELVDLVDNSLNTRVQIIQGTPQTAPRGKELRVGDDGKLYIGLEGVWYVINSTGQKITIDESVNARVTANGTMEILTGNNSFEDTTAILDPSIARNNKENNSVDIS